MSSDGGERGEETAGSGLALIGVAVLALLLRARSAVYVFAGAGPAVLRADDSQYHARRAAWTLENFPHALGFDPYLAYPAGAHVPWPPLWDFVLAAVAGVFGGGDVALERVLAWSAAVAASLTVVPVYALARSLASRRTALGAALLFALLPGSLLVSGVGSADHHAVVALEGATLLACAAHALRERPARLAALLVGLALARTAILLTWQGSILYLGTEIALFLTAAVALARTRVLAGYGLGLVASAAVVAPFAVGGTGPAGSVLELSRLHVALLLGSGAAALAMGALERWRPSAGAAARAVRLAVSAAAVGAVVALVTGRPDEITAALAYAGKSEPWIAHNFENVPLFAGGSAAVGRRFFDHLVWGVPLVPLVFALRALRPEARGPGLLLALWSAVFAVLALANARYANDFAPVAVVGLAVGLSEVARAATATAPLRRIPPFALALAVGAALLSPTLARIATGLPRLADAARDPDARYGPATFHRDAFAFATAVREATPAPADPFDPDAHPTYGLLAFPTLGSLLVSVGERPVTATGFGPYVGPDAFEATERFYGLESEADAVALARRLGARYVVTSREGRPGEATLLHRLHMQDGNAAGGAPALGRFRLVTEAPREGLALGFLSGTAPRRTRSPYKLFEVVEGAVVEARGAPGATLTAQVGIRTPTGRRFAWRTRVSVGDDGIAELRLPYATETHAPTAPLGPYKLSFEGRTLRLRLTDADVVGGRTVPLAEATEQP